MAKQPSKELPLVTLNYWVIDMKERPILFKTEMVKAILEGSKTETRRVINPQPSGEWTPDCYTELYKKVNGEPDINKPLGWGVCSEDGYEGYKSPYGKEGDLLYVRETWAPGNLGEVMSVENTAYKADYTASVLNKDCNKGLWKPSIHMPKAASRIWLRVKEVKVERIQDIDTESIKAEGVKVVRNPNGYPVIPLSDKHFPHEMLNKAFNEEILWKAHWIALWDSINSERKDKEGNHLNLDWASNPFVWVVKFEVISTNGKP